MNKIINWTFGSVFRTFGRIIAYILVGVLFSYILSKTGFKISDLFLDNVKALSITDNVQPSGYGYLTVGNNEWTAESDFYKRTIYSNESVQYLQFVFNQTLDMRGHNYVEFRQIVSNAMNMTTTDSSNVYRCTEWDCTQYCGSGACAGMCEEYTCTHTNYSTMTNTNIYQNFLTGLNVSYRIVDSNGNWNSCNLSNDTIVCPITGSGQFVRLELFVNFKTYPGTNFQLALSRGYILYKSTSGQIIDSIDSQTQQQQQQHEEIMDTNSTTTESSANDLFSNEVFEDNGGLSSIITAPLVMINQMLSNTCVSPSATWKGATISLPCGSMLWDRPNASQLKDLLNVFYGGFVCYYAIRKLFLMIEKMKDPTSDNIEVTDL